MESLSFFKMPILPTLSWKKNLLTWNLENAILQFDTPRGKEELSLADVLRGVQIFGTTGSGKTSGGGRNLALSYLRSGFGGLVLCVKADEADLWESLCKESGRGGDLIRVSAGGSFGYNLLTEEMRSASGPALISNVTNLLLDVSKLANRADDSSNRSGDGFWDQQLSVLISRTIVLVNAIHSQITARHIATFVSEAEHMARIPESRNSVEKTDFEKELISLMVKCVDHQISDAVDYFLQTFRRLPEKTRATILAMLQSVIYPLNEYPLEKMFSGDTTVSPNDAFQGKIIVVDVPVHTFKSVGQLAQSIWKNAFMNSIKVRSDSSRPVFLWADESQYFAEKSDVLFLTTVRSKRCSVVYLTQNIPNYEMKLGSKQAVDAILGSLNIRIFHQNNDPRTNTWATESIGKSKTMKRTVSRNETALFSSSKNNRNISESESYESDVAERVFTNLSEGGRKNNLQVEAIVHVAGHKFKNSKTWSKAIFRQTKDAEKR